MPNKEILRNSIFIERMKYVAIFYVFNIGSMNTVFGNQNQKMVIFLLEKKL